MKRILLLLLFGLGVTFSQAQTPITVDATQTAQQLIENVLVLGNCAEVNNVTSPNNSIIGGDTFQSFGSFDGSASSPAFPFSAGVILASNGVEMIPTGVPAQGGGFGWAGDPDLEALINEPGNTNNATVIEFDFIPFVDEISFNYFLASDEWPSFVCNFADTFAFILSGPGISSINDYDHDANPNTPDLSLDLGGLNIATLPGTNIPVNPTNVHDLSTTCFAGSLGEFAVPQLYDDVGEDDGTTMYFGRTVPLAATAQVIPGQTYSIKLAVADRADTILNTAVFIESASFDLGGIDLGPDITIVNGNAPCEGEIVTLDAGFSATNIQYFWAQDGQIIPGENNQTLEVTEAGVYEVGIQIGSTGAACFGVSNAVTIEFFPEPEFEVSLPLTLCQDDTLVLDGEPTNSASYTSVNYSWFKDGVEITGETNSTLTVSEGGTYEVVVDANACDDATNTFTVNLIDYQVSIEAPDVSCVGSGTTVTLGAEFTGLSQDQIDNNVTYEWTVGNDTFNTPTIDLAEGQEVTLTTTVDGCEETFTDTFTFFNIPELDIAGASILCGGETNTLNATPLNLNDLDPDNTTYTWTLDGNEIAGADAPVLDITEGGVYEITVNNNGCDQTASFEVELVDYTVEFDDDNIVICSEGNNTSVVLEPTIDGLTNAQQAQIFYSWSDGSDGETLTVTEGGTYSVEVDINGNCVKSADVNVNIIETIQVAVEGGLKCPGDSITIQAELLSDNDPGVGYQWFDDSGNLIPDETGSSITVEDAGDYTVIVDNQGCLSDPAVATVSNYAVDNCIITQGISPNENNDGDNDCMDLTWLNDESDIKKMSVFNRYGQLVFEENNYENTFCGQDDNGNDLATGTYFYVIELERESVRLQKGPVIKGWVYVNTEQQ
jgi:gliding motility-associated-like protein